MIKFKLSLAVWISVVVALCGCQSVHSLRQPSSVQYQYDLSKVNLLKWAAQNRILFQIPDASFADVSATTLQDNCQVLREPAWSQAVFTTLETLKKNPAIQNKIHVVQIKKADKPGLSISKDLDGLTYLTVNYAQHEVQKPITNTSQIPCDDKANHHVGEMLTISTYELPTQAQLIKTVKELPTRSMPDRWKFNTAFLNRLAEQMTILRFSTDLGFERAADGKSFFVQFLKEQAQATKTQNLEAFKYWLNEIAQRSHAGSYLKIMALVPDKDLGYGMGVTADSKTLAYPFLSYTSQEGKFTYTSLNQLDHCLEKLSARYKRGLASIRSNYSTQPDTFLYPGYICHTGN